MNLEGKIALVTGGAVRIGRAISLALAGAGARVVVHFRSSETAALELCGRINGGGGTAWAVAADLERDEECGALIARAAALAGPPDILVNNAAVFHKDTPDTLSPEKLRAEFQSNLFAPLILMRDFAALGRPGRIVNLLDRRIEGYDPSCLPYQLAKKGLAEATRAAALAWAPRVLVNGVAPGAVLPPPGEGADYIRDRAGVLPIGRPCTPEEVAGAVLFLLRSDGLNGQILFVDGGQHLV